VPEHLLAESALGTAGRARGVRLAEQPELGKIDLRGDGEDREFASAVGRVLDILLPTTPNSATLKGKVGALWLGPDQWLITCPLDDVAFFMNSLREALGGTGAALTEVSDGRVTFRLAGPHARDVLTKGCPLDLHPNAFPEGRTAGSLLAKASVLLHAIGEDSFDLHVGRSFAPYLWRWLEDAAQEYGLLVD
jgi:sarcosine oxidase subunit gamma